MGFLLLLLLYEEKEEHKSKPQRCSLLLNEVYICVHAMIASGGKRMEASSRRDHKNQEKVGKLLCCSESLPA